MTLGTRRFRRADRAKDELIGTGPGYAPLGSAQSRRKTYWLESIAPAPEAMRTRSGSF